MKLMLMNVLFIIATVCFQTTVASICVPGSTFKWDCNNCTCSSSGTEYSCTNKDCPLIDYKDKYMLEQNADGHVILKPKINNEQYVFDDDNEFVLSNRNTRKIQDTVHYPYPYVKDEISRSQDNNDYDIANNLDDEKDYSDEQSYVDADLEEARPDDRFNNINNWDAIIPKRRDYYK